MFALFISLLALDAFSEGEPVFKAVTVFLIHLIPTYLIIVGILFLYHLCRYEEKLLLLRFGDEYSRYMREVPMWVPRLKKK